MSQHWISDIGVGLLLDTQWFINGSEVSFSALTKEGIYRVGFFAAPIDANHQVLFDDYSYKN